MSGKRILLTGGAGFVGAVLTRELLRSGHRVHLILKSDSGRWRIADVLSDVQVHPADLRDEAAVKQVVAETKPEVIYHLATHGAYSSQDDSEAILQVNFYGTWNLLKASAALDYEVFVNTGSSSEYGFKDEAMRESDLLEPNSYYAVAKCGQTLLCQHFARAHKKPINTFRLFSAYGPYEEPSRLVPTLVARTLRGEALDLVPKEVARDFIFVDDVVDAYTRFEPLAQLSGEVINIGTGVQSTIEDVVGAVFAACGKSVECRWGKMPARMWDQRTWVSDCSKSKRLIGFRPRTSLTEGMAKTVRFFEAQR